MSVGIAFRAFFAALFDRQAAARLRHALEKSAEESAPTNRSLVDATAQPRQSPSSATSEGLSGSTGKSVAAESATAKSASGKAASVKWKASRSDALTLLSALQREARLVDLICEPLDQFSDEQIGAAAREVLKDSRQTLERLFAIVPLADLQEGEQMQLQSGHSPARLRLLGKSQGEKGVVVHRGWQATKCELPDWHGDRADALVVTPTEVEVA